MIFLLVCKPAIAKNHKLKYFNCSNLFLLSKIFYNFFNCWNNLKWINRNINARSKCQVQSLQIFFYFILFIDMKVKFCIFISIDMKKYHEIFLNYIFYQKKNSWIFTLSGFCLLYLEQKHVWFLFFVVLFLTHVFWLFFTV